VLLAIDARNRAISIGFYDRAQSGLPGKGRWLARRRLGAVQGRSSDEYAILLRALAEEALVGEAGGRRALAAAWMSSVSPLVSRELSRAIGSAFGLSCAIVGPGVKTGVKIRTDQPSEVGSDLVCAAAAAKELVGGPCVIVDFDAAIAFSAIGRTGDFLGAAIAPGIGTASSSLRSAAALLPEFALSGPPQDRAEYLGPAIGKNTVQSLKAGTGIGFAGLVERIVRRQRAELAEMGEADSPEAVAVIGTGDEEGRILFASLGLGRFVPDLVLEGLASIADRASPAPVASA
jgi:type III pantothenate kinase